MPELVFKARPIVPGNVEGEAVVVDSISFYGDVDPESGLLHDGRPVKDRILVARKSRGSTVGSYVIYALKVYKTHPRAILLGSSEPIVIAGAVLAGIPLFDSLPPSFFRAVKDGAVIKAYMDGTVRLVL